MGVDIRDSVWFEQFAGRTDEEARQAYSDTRRGGAGRRRAPPQARRGNPLKNPPRAG